MVTASVRTFSYMLHVNLSLNPSVVQRSDRVLVNLMYFHSVKHLLPT